MSNSSLLTRSCVLTAALLCFFLAIIQSSIWNGAETPPWILSLTIIHAASEYIYKTVGGPLDVTDYYFFGRVFFLVYLGLFVGLKHWRKRDLIRKTKPFRVFQAALIISLVGNTIAYWGGSWFGTEVRFIGFWLTEVPALTVACSASLVLGIQMMRHKTAPLHEAILFAGTPVLALVSTASFQYMPHGPIFGILLALLFLTFSQKEKPVL